MKNITICHRVLCYVVPVVLGSIALNIPKFFETEFTYTNR